MSRTAACVGDPVQFRLAAASSLTGKNILHFFPALILRIGSLYFLTAWESVGDFATRAGIQAAVDEIWSSAPLAALEPPSMHSIVRTKQSRATKTKSVGAADGRAEAISLLSTASSQDV
jgi:hypothetical protein